MKIKLEDYAWNQHERNIKAKQTEFTSTRPKIRITDDSELRTEIEKALDEASQKSLAEWAVKVATPFLRHLDDHLKDDPRIEYGLKSLKKRIDGEMNASDLRNVGFEVNRMAKESNSEISKYAARSFAQAIAVGHMRSHAMVSSDYAVKTTNLLYDSSSESSSKERKRQLNIIDKII